MFAEILSSLCYPLFIYITTIFIMKLITDLSVYRVNAELVLPWIYSKVIKVELY